jgi:hypothetical protein
MDWRQILKFGQAFESESDMLVGDAHHRRNVSLAHARSPAGNEYTAHQRSLARNALQRARAAAARFGF